MKKKIHCIRHDGHTGEWGEWETPRNYSNIKCNLALELNNVPCDQGRPYNLRGPPVAVK